MSPVGRPRVEGDREEEILEATFALLIDVGYDRLTMDAVAKRAHASKATLYRRWETKPALVIDALERTREMPQLEPADTGTLRGDLLATFCGRHGIAKGKASAVLGSVITAVATDAEFAQLFRERFVASKAAASGEIFRRAIERGEISADVDLDILTPALAGVVLHRAYVLGLPPDDVTVARVVDHLILPAATHPPTDRPTPDANPTTTTPTPTTTTRTPA